VTHIFNAMSGLTARNPGVIGATLNLPIYAGLIADLIHVDPINIELLYKFKKSQIYLVSDSVTPTGTTITEFSFADHTLYVKDNKIMDKKGVLGGAYLTLNQAVKNCVEIGIPLLDVLKMAVITPLHVMNFATNFGCIVEGNQANLIYMDLDNYNCTCI
jgi:N-acetylglucosamine-6-phosphate deacetylase